MIRTTNSGLLNALRLAAASLVLVAASASGSEPGEPIHPYLDWRHYVSLGLYEQTMHAEIGETRRPVPTTLAVNLDHLDVDDEHTDISLGYQFRITDRWSLVAAANRFAGDGLRGQDRSFSFGPFDVPLGRFFD